MSYERQVFINVPFDRRYRKLLNALVFAVHECGHVARCAQEQDDGGQIRLEKIYGIIESCRLGIHDLSRVTLDAAHRLPRFNMPLELGLFLGARRFGSTEQRRKSCLILDRDRYRFQVFCSDIAGQDIRAHGNLVPEAIRVVRNWLQASSDADERMSGPARISQRYVAFREQLPLMCRVEHTTPSELTFLDYRRLASAWIRVNAV